MNQDYFSSLPVELQALLTERMYVGESRLINRSILNANQVIFCKRASKITFNDIYDYINNYNEPFAFYMTSLKNNDIFYTYLFKDSIAAEFVIDSEDNYYIKNTSYTIDTLLDYIKAHIKNIDMDIDLLSTYNILKLRYCDDILPNYSKNTVIKKLQSLRLNIYHSSVNILLNIHKFLLTNAIIMHLYTIDLQGKMILHNPGDSVKFIRDECKILYNDIMDYLKTLD